MKEPFFKWLLLHKPSLQQWHKIHTHATLLPAYQGSPQAHYAAQTPLLLLCWPGDTPQRWALTFLQCHSDPMGWESAVEIQELCCRSSGGLSQIHLLISEGDMTTPRIFIQKKCYILLHLAMTSIWYSCLCFQATNLYLKRCYLSMNIADKDSL